MGSQSAHRTRDNSFETDDGEKLDRTDGGWKLHRRNGETLSFAPDGRLLANQPAAGEARMYDYDKEGRLIAVGTSTENTVRYQYDGAGRVTVIDGPEKLRLSYRYDGKGRLASVTNARNVQVDYRYSDNGALLGAFDHFGNELNLENAKARLLPAQGAAAAALSLAPNSKFKFDEKRRLKGEADGAETASFEYDGEGRMSTVSSPQGRATCKYDGFGRMAEMLNADGTSLRFQYNNLDQPTLVTRSDGSAEKLTYNEHGILTRRERSPSEWEEFVYDNAGRLVLRRRPPAAEERYTYGDGERIARIRYTGGSEVAFEYDLAGRVLSESWSSGEKRLWRYDADGRLIETVSPGGLKRTFTYNANGQLASSEDSLHGKTSYRATDDGNIVDNAAGKTITSLSDWGKPLEVVEPGGGRSTFRYETRGLLDLVVTPLQLPWRYEYDSAARLTSIIAPSGLRTSVVFDPAGRRSKLVRGDVAWREYRYGSAGRIEQEYSAAGPAARFKYDGNGAVTEAELPDGKVVYKTDDAKLLRTRKGAGYEIEEQFNPDGTLARRKFEPAKLEVKLPLDSAGRAAAIELNELKATYSYDERGRFTGITLPGGIVIKITSDEAARPTGFNFGDKLTATISWDRADRITAIEARATAGKSLFSERYAYDGAGNLAQRVTDGGTATKFEYDAELRLKRITGTKITSTFTYDIDGNLTSNSDGSGRAQLDALGRPVAQGAASYSWDAAGNLLSIQRAGAKAENEFDAAGRLTGSGDGKTKRKFGYLDGPDRLWSEGPVGRRYFAYLDDRLVGLKDETGVTWLIVALPGTDRPIALCSSNGKTLFVLYDRMGSARRFIDSAGAIVARDDYAPFGKLEATEGKAPLQMFAGMVRDESGLFYARNRYYDHTIARFISIDPLIGTPGIPSSHNAYAYAANNPLRYRDPMGTSFEDEIANYHEMYDYEYLTDPRDPTGNTPLKYESGPLKGEPIPKTYESGPFKGEPIVNKSSTPVAIRNNGYDMLTSAEQTATRQAYDGAKAARQTIQNPAASAEQVQAAAAAAARHEAELARLHEISKLRYGHALNLTGTESGWGGANSNRMMTDYERRMTELGADPLAHYSNAESRPVVQARASGLQAEADAAARDARAQGAFGRGPKTDQVQIKPNPKDTTGAVSAKDAAEGAGKGTMQVKPGSGTAAEKTGQVAAESGAKSSADLAASAREKMERGIKNNEAISISKEEMAAYRAEEAARKGGTAAETAGGAGEVVYNPKTRTWGPAGAAGRAAGEVALEGAGERWLGPKILDAGGKVLKVAQPLLHVMTAIDVARLGGAMANNFIDNLNLPFANEQKDKQAAKWMAEDFIKRMAELAASDPNAVILGDGRKFDPNSPADMEEILRNLGQNLFFGRKPFDGIFKYPPKLDPKVLPKTFMGAAPGDTAAEFSLENARKLLQMAHATEKTAREAATELVRQDAEAQSQLQSAMTIAGARAVVESDVATVPEKVADLKTQAAAVQAQVSTLQTADSEMRAAIAKCEDVASKLCDFASRAAEASENEVAAWRKEATNDLSSASALLNNAQAKADGADVSIDQLKTAIAVLDGLQAKLAIYQGASMLAEKTDVSPDAALAAAKTAARNAETERTKLTTAVGELNKLVSQITGFVAPYTAADPEAAIINSAANSLGKGLSEPSFFNFNLLLSAAMPIIDAALANQKAVERAMGNVDLESALNAAREVLSSAESFTRGAKAIASGVERYRPLQTASQCFALIKAVPKVADSSPSPTASPGEEEVLVPDLGVHNTLPEMKAAAIAAGFVPTIAASSKAEGKRLYVGQNPSPNTMAKKGKPLQILVSQAIAVGSPSPSPTPVAATSPSPGEDLVVVPSVTGAQSIDYARTILNQAGFKSAFTAVKPEKKDQELTIKTTVPAPGEKAPRGSKVMVLIYQKFDDTAAAGSPSPSASPSPSSGETVAGTMPRLIGLTLDQATSRLPSNATIGGDEVGDKPTKPEEAYTIFAQNPQPGDKIPPDKKVVVTVKRYGSAKTDDAGKSSGDSTAAAGSTSSENPLGGTSKGHGASWTGKVTRADGTNAGDWSFSTRKRKAGGFYYFLNGVPLDQVKVEGGKVSAKVATDVWVFGKPEILRAYQSVTIEPSAGGKVRITMTDHTVMRSGGEKKVPAATFELAPNTQAGAGDMDMPDETVDEMISAILEDARKKNKEHEEQNARSK